MASVCTGTWRVSFGRPRLQPDQSAQIGITSTPVIDRASGPHGTIYALATSKNSSKYFHRIHALDITTGQEEFGGPVAVKAKYPGKGDNSHDGYVIFDPEQYAERQGLLLLNHVIYTGWTSHCDSRPYTGWLIGYSESMLTQTSVLNVTPNGNEGSIWQSGAGIASESQNLFFLDANGTFDTTLDKKGFPIKGDYGNGFLKVSTTNNKLRVVDYFSMFNTVQESEGDQDLGSGGALILPPMKDAKGKIRYLAIGAGKDQNIYIVDRTNMGKFNPNNEKVQRRLPIPAARRVFPPTVRAMRSFGRSSTAILSIYCMPLVPPIWRTSSTIRIRRERDRFGTASHFGTPMIVNGKVYLGTTKDIAVFGLLKR